MIDNNIKISALLFDLDGTLVDTAPDFIYVLNNLREKYGFQPLDHRVIRNTVSNGARSLIKLAFGGDEGQLEFEQYKTELLSDYLNIAGDYATLFDGMREVLLKCNEENLPWGIITNKPRIYTLALLKKLNLIDSYQILLCADDVQKPKPDPESMFIAANKLNIKIENAVYVGDHPRDIQAGNSANMITVAAEYGYFNKNDDINCWSANYIIKKPIELIQFF